MREQVKPTISSFFAGMGGLDLGFKELFDIHWANELNPHAARCYAANIGNHIRVGDITSLSLSEIKPADGFIGGPSCIDFSSSGKNRGLSGDHGLLSLYYMKIIGRFKPAFFLFENVYGLLTHHPSALQKILKGYSDLGYNISWTVWDAASFGVAQYRKRIFIVGVRKDQGIHFQFPDPPMVYHTVRDALHDLPEPDTIGAREKRIGTIPNHTATWESPSPQRIAELTEHPRNQHRGLRSLLWDKPSPTITSHIAKDGREYLFPEGNRRITVREALRLSGFPDDFILPEDVPLSAQYRCVGNCVVYPISKRLSEELYKQLYGK